METVRSAAPRRAAGAAAVFAAVGCLASARPAHGQALEGPQDYALVDVARYAAVGEQAVQRGVVTGRGRYLLRANTDYRLFKLDRNSLRVGYIEFRSGANGARFELPPVPLRSATTSFDLDRDELSDLAEFVLGSDPADSDTDDDGILDGAAARAGIFGQSLLRTGIIASVDLFGSAQDVCALNDRAAVALGNAGVVVANVFTRMNPVIVAQVTTPGDARRVALGGSTLAVACGPSGLVLVDVSAPPAAPIRSVVPAVLLGGGAQAVAIVARLAIVGLSNGNLATVDLASGSVLERVALPTGLRSIEDVVVSGDVIYALDRTTVHALALTPGRLAVTSSTETASGSYPNRRLSAGGGVLRVVHGNGCNTFDLADPLRPAPIAVGRTQQFDWRQLAENGSGLGLAVVGTLESVADGDLVLLDVRDPAQTNAALTRFETPGGAQAVSIFGGLAYVAEGELGLHVVNYLSQDRLGVAPTISLSTNQPLPDRCEEGALLRVTARCQDDVQVRTCELFVDGVKTETDGNFPFEFFLVTPRLAQRPTLSVRVRVSDTGGNSAFSDPLTFTLTPDTSAPNLVRVVPGNGGLTGRAGAVAAFFDEPLDPASLTAATFRLVEAGPDLVLGTADDRPIAGSYDFQPELLGAFLTPPGGLAPGRYRASLEGVRDPVGNVVATTTWSFTVYGPGGADQDADGLPDVLEQALGLRADLADTDGDGTPDGQEDADGDLVPNAVEIVLAFDPLSADSDGDLILDRNEDQDRDQLTDVSEVARGSDPFRLDTDGDGFNDGAEVSFTSDPLDRRSTPLRRLSVSVAVVNRAPAGVTARRVITQASVQNLAYPTAIGGRSTMPPTSVRNNP